MIKLENELLIHWFEFLYILFLLGGFISACLILPDFIVGSNVENRASEYGEITKARRNRYDISQKCDSKAS